LQPVEHFSWTSLSVRPESAVRPESTMTTSPKHRRRCDSGTRLVT
jgi:hypothetical protein